MANVASTNTIYIDSTGSITSPAQPKVMAVVLTATSANARIVLADDSTSDKKLDLRVATSGSSQVFDFSQSPIFFANGVSVATLTNAIATLVYTSSGGRN
jgi:hypothetical protein